MKQAIRYEESTGIEITASMLPSHSGMFKVTVIHRFPSGNFVKKEHDNQSQIAAEGLLKFYTKD